MPATADKGVAGEVHHALLKVSIHIQDVVGEILVHVSCGLEALNITATGHRHEFKVRKVVQRPAYRQLHQRGLIAPLDSAVLMEDIPLSGVERGVVGAHEAGVVQQAQLQHDFYGMWGVVPTRGAASPGRRTGEVADDVEGAMEDGPLLLRGERAHGFVQVPVQPDFMPCSDDSPALVGIGVYGVAGYKEGDFDAATAEQVEESLDGMRAELASRDGRRTCLPLVNPERKRVEVKGQVDDAVWHVTLLAVDPFACVDEPSLKESAARSEVSIRETKRRTGQARSSLPATERRRVSQSATPTLSPHCAALPSLLHPSSRPFALLRPDSQRRSRVILSDATLTS